MATLSLIPLGHYQLKSANELAEGFVFPLGQTPEIDIRSFSIYEHRVLFEKFRCELSKTSDRISLKACDPFEGCSFQILDEQAAVAGVFFTVLQSRSSHRNVESLKVRLRIDRTIILWYFDFPGSDTLISEMRVVKGVFRAPSSSLSISVIGSDFAQARAQTSRSSWSGCARSTLASISSLKTLSTPSQLSR